MKKKEYKPTETEIIAELVGLKVPWEVIVKSYKNPAAGNFSGYYPLKFRRMLIKGSMRVIEEKILDVIGAE